MDWSQVTFRKIRGLIVFTIAILVGLWNFDKVLGVLGLVWEIAAPFVLGGAIAFVINVPMSFLEAKIFGEDKKKRGKAVAKLARPLSLILTIAIVLGVIVLVIFVLVPQLGDTFKSLGSSIAMFIPKLQEWIGEFTNNNVDVMKWVDQIEFNPDKMISWGVSLLGSGAENMMNTTVTAVSNIVSGIATFFIAFSFACYILFQKEKLHVQVRKVFFAFMPKRKAEVVLEICSLTYKTFSSFLTGQCVEAVILGSMFVVAMTLLRMPYALLTGIIIAFTALIPIFGAFIGCALGAFMIFMVNPKQAVIFVILFLVLQQVEGNLIYPHVVGGSVGLPSIWVLAAVSIGGSLMGVIGMLIFIPIVSVLYALFREFVYLELKKHKIKKVTAQTVEEYSEKEIQKMREAFEAEHAND
ncbi:MAG: AI-2E family transporter [Bariatricus sp.]|nr:AI-2E family transporter [Bariatricus sp.]